jgi:D-hydroxyproline dehydrogenase subunit alpha
MESAERIDEMTVAAAMLNREAGLRTSVTGSLRGPLCGMGICFECRATIDGEPQRLTCQAPWRPGMRIDLDGASAPCAGEIGVGQACSRKRLGFDILIVGGGPAGMAAAVAAAENGKSVGVLDDNLSWGGQIWRGASGKEHSPARTWITRAKGAGVSFMPGARVVCGLAPHCLLAETSGEVMEVTFAKLILATGARELFLPFPGWTLPNVMGAGGLQALVKGGLTIAGKRVVVAGSGPLLWAVAVFLKRAGAHVIEVAEQAPLLQLAALTTELVRQPVKLWQTLRLRLQLSGTTLRRGTYVSEAHGTERLEAVTLTDGRSARAVTCDYLACGFGLVPNVELATHLGCVAKTEGDGECIDVDQWQRTSVDDVYCAGEVTGIGGLERSLAEGTIAGLAAAGRLDLAARHLGARESARRFGRRLQVAFALRSELKSLARSDTLVCRCEDIAWGQLRSCDSWREAKLLTRCGMGPCQGRVCGAALSILRGWRIESVRPPVFPARLESFLPGSP